MRDEPIEPARPLDGDDLEEIAVPVDLDRRTRLEHPIEDAVEVPAKLSGSEPHAMRIPWPYVARKP